MLDYYITKTAPELEKIGMKLAKILHTNQLIFLSGDLGVGKTTLSRGILRGFGYQGLVKSPTYTLVESYCFKQLTVHHFDLYRLNSALELEEMGFRDYLSSNTVVLIEWPEKAALSKPDLHIKIDYHPNGRSIKINQ